LKKGVIVFKDDYLHIAFTPPSLFKVWTERVRLFIKKVNEHQEILKDKIAIIEPRLATLDELLLAHTMEYINYVKRKSQSGFGYLDYGDTPAYPNTFEKASLAVGGTLKLTDLLLSHNIKIGFNPQGGFHHAKRDRASGFCVFNDIAIAALKLRDSGIKRIAIIDIDAHHGDGTQEILYDQDILKISYHMYSLGFFPGSGYIDELGEGDGYGYSVNIPLPPESGDDIFKYVTDQIVKPLVEYYKPEAILFQMGVDGYQGDPLTYLRFTDFSYYYISKLLSEYMKRTDILGIIGVGGGGYNPINTSDMWFLMLNNLIENKYKSRPLTYTTTDDKIFSIVRERTKITLKKLREIHNF